MTLVETVAPELQDQLENLLGLLLRHTLGHGALDEIGLELGNDLRLLLGDSLDQLVGVGQFDAAKLVEYLHDLFLVHHDPVGFRQDLVHDRVNLGDLLRTMLTIAVGRNQFHRTRPIQSVGCNQVLDPVGTHLHQ